MAWLRIDDGFPQHRKLIRLSRPNRWTWLEILAYCARYRTGGEVPVNVGEAVKYASPKFLERCVEVGLLDKNGESLNVHDWDIYNGSTIEERVSAYLEQNPNATANAVHKAIGGKRELVLGIVKSFQSPGSPSGSPVVPDQYPDSPLEGSPHTRVRTPSPSPSSTSSSSKDVPDDDEIRYTLKRYNPTQEQLSRWLSALSSEPARFKACYSAAKAKGRNVAAYLDTLLSNGSYPDQEETQRMIDVNQAAQNVITGQGWDEATSEDAMRETLERLTRNPKYSGTLDLDSEIGLWQAERAKRYPTPAAKIEAA